MKKAKRKPTKRKRSPRRLSAAISHLILVDGYRNLARLEEENERLRRANR